MNFSAIGAVNLSVDELMPLQLVHLYSEWDSDVSPDCRRCGSLTELQGYTEWMSTTTPCLSLGWDWHYVHIAGRYVLQRKNDPRTNIQLVTRQGCAIAWQQNLDVLAHFIDAFCWQTTIQRNLSVQ